MMQNFGNPQPMDNFTTSAMNQQDNNFLGQPPIQAAAMPTFDAGALNSTSVQNNPAVASMVKALKGGAM